MLIPYGILPNPDSMRRKLPKFQETLLMCAFIPRGTSVDFKHVAVFHLTRRKARDFPCTRGLGQSISIHRNIERTLRPAPYRPTAQDEITVHCRSLLMRLWL